jgi:SPX domain protein involved in polyphosphate accumulation
VGFDMTDNADSQIHLDRTEDKYLVSKEFMPEFMKSIKHFMEPSYPHPDTKFVINKSIYFDSPDLMCLQAHLNQADTRFKIRIRTYAPNGIWGSDRFVEIKHKNDGDTKKDRLRIGYDGYRSLIEKSLLPIDDELYALNSDTLSEAETKQHAMTLNSLLIHNNMKPVIELNYHRLAFKQGEDVRVTIDEDIEMKPLPNLKTKVLADKDIQKKLEKFEEKYLNFEDFIMEMKYTDKTPKWFRRKTDKLLLEPERFSKYVWSMSRLGTNELRPLVK